MSRSVFSQSWHNVAGLQPQLPPHAKFHRHLYRGQCWYVVHDSTSRRYHRLTPASYAFAQRMNGQRTVQELWEAMCNDESAEIPTQNEIVDLLAQLHANDLLLCNVTPDAAQLFDRFRKHRRSQWKQRLANPLSLRVPLIDPDAFLTRWSPRVAWLFGPWGAALWLAVVLPAALLALQHWSALTHNVSDQVLAAQNMVLLAMLFVPIKVLHELGHGFATKIWGGPVPEMGFMLLVFAPVPYVDSSSAATFPAKHRRVLVGAAGMIVELFLAAIALYIWLLAEPGLLRAVAFNVMLIAGVSTLLVNGNPLLRFDGYYILCDLIEIPNLAQRGQRYWKYLSDRHLMRARDLEVPVESAAERRWLAFYTPASWCYRIFITVSIILFIAGEFFIFGVLIALWGAVTLLLMPLWKAYRHVTTSPTLRGTRSYAIRVTLAFVAAVAAILILVPMPLRTQSEGVVWLPDRAILRAGADGFFQQWLLPQGTAITSGIPVSIMNDDSLEADIRAAQARVAEYQARYDAVQFAEPAEASIVEEKLVHEKAQLEHFMKSQERLVVATESSGLLVAPQAADMTGRYFKKGELLGYVWDRNNLLVRVAVTQDDIDLVRSRLKSVELRLVDHVSQTFGVSAIRELPSAVNDLPSPALSSAGGGIIPLDPQATDGQKTLQGIFLFDMELPAAANPTAFGSRVYVRFNHVPEPLCKQWYRRLRQLFLSRLYV